jgi:ferredoxin-NADP reductase
MMFYVLVVAATVLSMFVFWLLIDGILNLAARLRLESRRRKASRPLRLVVAAREEHTADLFSLTLTRIDGKRLPAFLPGQYLSLRVPAGEAGAAHTRRYSLAAWHACPKTYRLGIRRVPGGRVSTWLHQYAKPGLELEALPPAGDFVLHGRGGEVVLVGGGIGVTPLLAMLDFLVARPGNVRQVWLYYAAREEGELVDAARLFDLEKHVAWFHLRCFLSRPGAAWQGGRGRLSALDLTRELADPATASYYLCARAEMMDALTHGLLALGVPGASIHRESFGGQGNSDNTEYRVHVAGHGSYVFQGQPSLLHALENWGLPIQADCRAGECGACQVRLVHGEIREGLEPTAGSARKLAADQFLACCAVPATDLEIVLPKNV